MIEAQNGELRATSELGQGCTFTMTVPTASRELPRA
jgi:chemotaxis protein histidine kinase CheA